MVLDTSKMAHKNTKLIMVYMEMNVTSCIETRWVGRVARVLSSKGIQLSSIQANTICCGRGGFRGNL